MNNFQDRVVLVVDGTSEQGQMVVRSELESGATVIVSASSKQRIKQLKKKLAGIGLGFLVPMVADARQKPDAGHIINHIRRRFGKLDILIAPFDGVWQTLSLTDITSRDTTSDLFIGWREAPDTKLLISAWLEAEFPKKLR